MEKVCIVYKFTNTITGDFYIGSRKNVKLRLAEHKRQSVWIAIPNDQMYQDIQKYGEDKFDFEILEILEVAEADKLKEVEQEFIETLKPAYNQMNPKDLDIDKHKESQKKAQNKYNNQLCFYNGETITLAALYQRFRRAGIEHPTAQAKKYLVKEESNNPVEFYDIYP